MNLDIVSRIDDEIIEKNTVKRARLLAGKGKRNNKKLVLLLVAVITLVAIMIPLFIVLFSKQVPVYEGMTVSSTYQSSTAEAGGVAMLSASGRTQIDFLKDDNGNHNGQNKKPVEDIVDDEFSSSLTIPDQHMYYAKPSQDIYITVHISNPDSFEILSFTLNGKKYSSYMFEDGSDMEDLILKVTVPAGAEGITEYTIDAIKYVDGTAIKDVRMEGNRTVKVGVYSAGKQPTAQIADELIGINDISFTASINDRLDLIKMSEGNVFVVICDNSSVVYKQELNPDEVNNIKFDSLIMDTTYRYAIVANYDSLDGTSFSTHILYEKEFTTKNIVAFMPASITQESISFTLEWEESFENKVLDSLALYKGEEKVRELDVNTTSIDGLLSNNEYRLVATYTNKGETETSDLTFTTLAKAEPTFTFKNMASEIYSISGEYDITNIDDTLISYKVELYKEDELVKENTDKEIAFDSLDYYTDYTVKITYTFDVSDGKGVQTKTAEYAITTDPYIDVESVIVRNTTAVSTGESIYLQIDVINPCNAKITEVTINGNRYVVSDSSTAERVFIEIVCDETLGGGEVALTVERICAIIDEVSYDLIPASIKSNTLFINGVFELVSVEFVDEQHNPKYWHFEGEKLFVKIKLNNPTDYEIREIELSGSSFANHGSAFTDTVTKESIIRINENEYIIDFSEKGLDRTITQVKISYGNQYISKSIKVEDLFVQCVFLGSSEKTYISTAQEFLEISCGDGERKYYELTTDIDFSGIQWTLGHFNGVLNANGHSIKNLTLIGDIGSNSADPDEVGIFTDISGVVYDLSIENAFIMANGKNIRFGLLTASNHGSIISCSIDNSSVINISGAESVGGFTCYNYGLIKGCINNASISGDGGCFSGIAGDNMSGKSNIVDCINNGNIVSDETSSGIATHNTGKITDCVNNGNIMSGYGCYASGIAAENVGIIRRCTNNGTIVNEKQGGSFGIASYNEGEISDCINNGLLEGDRTAGIVDYNFSIITNCFNTADLTRGCGITNDGSSGSVKNCVNAGHVGYVPEWGETSPIAPSSHDVENCYTLFVDENVYVNNASICSIDQLNSKEFYIETLGWSEDVWDFSELDYENGKYPTLK